MGQNCFQKRMDKAWGIAKMGIPGMLLLILWHHAIAQNGAALIRNYAPKVYRSPEYTSGPQNRCVLQDPLGRILVSNQDVTLCFDGKRWSPVEGTEGKSFFKMALGSDGLVYSGGDMELGYFTADSLGRLHLQSLLAKLPTSENPVGTIFNVVSDADGGILFLDRQTAYLWRTNSMFRFESKSGYRKATSIGGKILLQAIDDGLWELQGNKLQRIIGSEALDGLNIRGIHQLGDPHAGELLVVTNDQGIFKYKDRQLEKLPSELDGSVVWNTTELPDGRIGLATSTTGLVILDPRSLQMERITQADGLFSNSLSFPNVDAEEGIWLASELGLTRMDRPEAILPIKGEVQSNFLARAIVVHDRELLLGTSDGCKALQQSGRKAVFPQVLPTQHAVSAFAPFQDGLLIACDLDGIYAYQHGEARQISSIPATAIQASTSHPDRYFVGTNNGLYSIRYEKGKWVEEGKIEGLDHKVYHIAELPNGDVWASFRSASRLRFGGRPLTQPEVVTFDSAQGFSDDHVEFELFPYEDRLYFGTNRGIFRFDEGKNQLFPDATFGDRFADKGHGARHLAIDLQGQIWLYDGKFGGVLRKSGGNAWHWDDLPLRHMDDDEIWSIYPGPDSLIWIGTTTSLYCHDPRVPKDYHVPFHTLIDRVTLGDTLVVFFGNYADPSGRLTAQQPDRYKLTFPFTQNDIAFSYTATSYESPEKTVFSHWLEGLEAGWSPWSAESDKAYNDLPEGTYTFHARAKNLYDTVGAEAAYTFTILPPWYRTWWAWTLYALAGIGFVFLLVRWQVSRANRKQEAAREVERQQQRDILRVAVETQETERMRIALDLHDEVGAMLSTVKMSLKLSQRKLDKEGVDNTLEESTGLLDNAISSVREISHDLLPPSLESLGLATTVGQLTAKTGRISGIPFACEVTGTEQRLPIRSELTLYRVVQELITNSLKHSQATERGLDLVFEETRLRIRFRDNGVGVDLPALQASAQGLGLRGMASRIESLGGTLQLQSALGQGFSAEIVLPIPAAA